MNDITREELSARLELLETRMAGRLSSVEQMIGTKFTELDSTLRQTRADTIKWVASIVLASGVLGLALIAVLIDVSLH